MLHQLHGRLMVELLGSALMVYNSQAVKFCLKTLCIIGSAAAIEVAESRRAVGVKRLGIVEKTVHNMY